MDIAEHIRKQKDAVKCIDMHTCGEPTRIIYAGFPETKGTLLDQRDQVNNQHDELRRMLMHEPRGHHDMYGALLRPETELTLSGEADIGVLFMHNGGLSTMCGHASIALGRFLVDTHDLSVFPRREKLRFNAETKTVDINLHAPCGLVRITAPTNEDGTKSDPSRAPSFLSVPSYSPKFDLEVSLAGMPVIEGLPKTCKLDLVYGGAFYAVVDREFFKPALAAGISEIELATQLKRFLCTQEPILGALNHEDPRMNFLYGVSLSNYDQNESFKPEGVEGSESTVLIFADDELDRSPTGSCVAARMALAHAKGLRGKGQRWAYNSLVSNHFKAGAFSAEIAEVLDNNHVVVKVEGEAYYTGAAEFIKEPRDKMSSFLIKEITH